MKKNSSIGHEWKDVRSELFSSAEINESDLRVSLIGEITQERLKHGFSQKKLEELSGVKQPIIARMESGKSIPNLSTLLKLLAPLGKTLCIKDINK